MTAMGRLSTKDEILSTHVSLATARRERSMAKVEPKLEGLPDTMPLNSQHVPKDVLTAEELEITENYSVTELLAKLKSRSLSVEKVTRAFLRRAAVAQAMTNCLTELLWDQAIARAKSLDALPEPKGALFGLPISTKEHHGMVGENIVTSASYATYVGRPHGSNVLYDSLYAEGCVFFARTTQPQTIMHLETNSNVYGRTVNPYNRNLTPGGSSGGESALLGIRGSILGIGGDVGGSIRCPAAHCGLYGFKPSTNRISAWGSRGINPGRESILGTPGPMTVERDALELFMQVAVGAQPWKYDPAAIVKDWTPYKFTRPLKIAVQWWDGVVMPHPPMIRALKEVVEACRKAGHEIVEWDSESLDHKEAWDILSALYWPDGGKQMMGLLEQGGEEPLPLTKFIVDEQPTVKELTQNELWELCIRRDQYRVKYAQAWTKTGEADGKEVDIILCPPSFGAATPHDQSRYWGYTSQWNLLDYPGAVFPVTTVDVEKDPADSGYVPKNSQDEFVHNLYSSETFAGLPINLQIIGRRYHEEKVLAALREIEQAMGRQ